MPPLMRKAADRIAYQRARSSASITSMRCVYSSRQMLVSEHNEMRAVVQRSGNLAELPRCVRVRAGNPHGSPSFWQQRAVPSNTK